jgi:hypothetical protein
MNDGKLKLRQRNTYSWATHPIERLLVLVYKFSFPIIVYQ